MNFNKYFTHFHYKVTNKLGRTETTDESLIIKTIDTIETMEDLHYRIECNLLEKYGQDNKFVIFRILSFNEIPTFKRNI